MEIVRERNNFFLITIPWLLDKEIKLEAQH